MKTLVIHPSDSSTDFLKEIYRDKNFTVINDPLTTERELKKQINNHDRIIMMGHGWSGGLFGFRNTRFDMRFVPLLREKLCVCIWCNADEFFKRHNLIGFYTGMFISEVKEASYFGIKITQEKIDYSNNLFAGLMNEYIDYFHIFDLIKESYVGDCPVIRFNNERLYEDSNVDFDDDYRDDINLIQVI